MSCEDLCVAERSRSLGTRHEYTTCDHYVIHVRIGTGRADAHVDDVMVTVWRPLKNEKT